MASAPLFNAAGQPAGETPLEDAIFGAKISEPLIHQAVVRELAHCDLIVTAVGAGNLPDVSPLIASGLSQRSEPGLAGPRRGTSAAGGCCGTPA